MSENNRPIGAIAVKLDPETLLEQARVLFPQQYEGVDPAQLGHGPLPQMLFAVERGNGAVVNGEGVGAIANENNEVAVHFSYYMEWVQVVLPLSNVAYAATEERIDLAEGIRTFGSRLNVNHRQWFDRYDKDNSAQE